MSTNFLPAARNGIIRQLAALFVALALALIVAVSFPASPAGAQTQAETRAQTTLERGDLVAPAPAVTPSAVLEAVDAADAADVADPEDVAAGSDAYTPMKPTPGKGMPVDGAYGFQDQYSQNGHYALWMHDVVLMPLIVAISLFVLALLLWVVVRFNRRRNQTPSKTTHNTLIEVVWTLVPVLILVGIAIPSITLLARQYETPPENAVTIKATGYQWYWTYTYPDNGGFEVISNMLSDEEAKAAGEPSHLGVDNRLVVPAGVPLRIQTTAADVIHSFAVPSLWFKIDAVPGRLNERLLVIDEPGVYYGQCSELCGARHGYMPIAVEALPVEQWRAWVRSQGGTFGEAKEAPALPPTQTPESAVPDAAGAGAPPTQAPVAAATTAP